MSTRKSTTSDTTSESGSNKKQKACHAYHDGESPAATNPDDDNDKNEEEEEEEEEDSTTTIKRLKLENNELKKQARKKEEEEERKQRNKQSFKCCIHINESGFTKLQPNDRNTDEPSRYNAYSDECEVFGNEGPMPVHFSQGSNHYLEWQCGCRDFCNGEQGGFDFFTLLCSECEEEKLHPTPTCGSFAGDGSGCGRKESDCGAFAENGENEGYCQKCIKEEEKRELQWSVEHPVTKA
mgnify:CR=1 FL=1